MNTNNEVIDLMACHVPANSDYRVAVSVEYKSGHRVTHSVALVGQLQKEQTLFHIPHLDDQIPQKQNETQEQCPYYDDHIEQPCLSLFINRYKDKNTEKLVTAINKALGNNKIAKKELFNLLNNNQSIPNISDEKVQEIRTKILDDDFKRQYELSLKRNGCCDDLIIIDNNIILIEAKTNPHLPDCKIYSQLLSAKGKIQNIIQNGSFQGCKFDDKITQHLEQLKQSGQEIKYTLILCMIKPKLHLTHSLNEPENNLFPTMGSFGTNTINNDSLPNNHLFQELNVKHFNTPNAPGITTTRCPSFDNNQDNILITFHDTIDVSDFVSLNIPEDIWQESPLYA